MVLTFSGRIARTFYFVVAAAAFLPPASAQPSLVGFDEDLNALQSCLGEQAKVVAQLRRGLTTGWNRPAEQGPVPPPPASYIQSLHNDVHACKAASKLKDPALRKQALDAIAADLALKVSDCRKFGAGRMVPVRVTTLRAAAAESGWEVYYRWLISSDLQPDELRAPQLTSPSRLQLPPGTYQFRAQKAGSTATQTIRVTVGLQPEMDVQLPIP
jgi:hypothetical protein